MSTNDAASRSAERFVLALAGGAVAVYGACIAILARSPPDALFAPTTLLVAAALAAAYVVSQFSAFEFEWRGHWLTATLDEAMVFLGLLWLPGPGVVLLLPLAEAIETAIAGRPRVKGIFNVAQTVVSTAAAWDVSLLAGWLGAPPLLAAAVAIPVYVVTSNFVLAGLFARLEKERTFRVYAQRFAPATAVLLSIGIAGGVTIAILASVHPLAVLALAPFVFAIRRNTRLASRADRELKAQHRLADLGASLVATWDPDRIADSILRTCGSVLPVGRATLAVEEGRREWTLDFEGGPVAGARSWSAALPGRDGAPLGSLTVYPRPGQRPLDEVDEAIVRSLAGQAAGALLNARAVHALEEGHARELQQQEHLARQEKLSSLGMLIANVAHEIGNPLSYMVLSLQSLKITADKLAASPDPEVRKSAETLQKGIATAQRGADNVVHISKSLRAVARQGQSGVKPLDLNAVAADVANVTRVGFPKHVKIDLGLWASPAMVSGNAGELTQVVMNLAKNAAEAIGERPGVVSIRTVVEGARVLLHVEDDGPGIPPATLERLFTPFFTTKEQGTGIGLHISRGIAKAHMGELRCESEVGRGTRFTLDLPALAADPAPQGPAEDPPKLPSAA